MSATPIPTDKKYFSLAEATKMLPLVKAIVADTGSSPEEVTILGPDHLTAYAELEMVAPGTTQTMVAVLGPGRYVWYCEADDGTESYSDERPLTGPPVKTSSPDFRALSVARWPAARTTEALVSVHVSVMPLRARTTT